MKTKNLTQVSNITTGKLDANAEIPDGKFPFFTCAPTPLRINTFSFDDDVVLLAGNNAQGNFHLQRYKGKFDAYQRTYVITAKKGYDIDYIKYSLELSLKHLKRLAQGSQTKFLTMQILDSFQVLDFPYEDQKTLISSVYAIDSKIRLNDRICSELESMAKTLYDYWFVQFDFPDENGKPYRTSGGEMVWNKQLKREIPKGWEAKNIQEICAVVDCLHSKKPDLSFEAENYYLLQLDNLVDMGLLDLSNKYYVSANDYAAWTSKIEVRCGDLVITNAGRVGDIARIPEGIICGIGRNMTAIRAVNVDPIFMYYFFASSDMKAQIKSNTDTGSFFGSLNVRGIKQLIMPIPSKESEIMNRFIDIVRPIRENLEMVAQQSQELLKLRDWLLPMLMNGQARVE
ncbi:restriction endonuclease subunit S [Blautia sp. LMAG:89]|uniref:restriction endonuclease subunit S n=1 Tax=Blautia sp. LMAG:89 TaxID=1969173 RepID=UPI002580F623|nr:restriction endonuclease subunit S [Blautia sp. LMAG:89]